jgi:DNA-binding NarL/FixJ family response regulator
MPSGRGSWLPSTLAGPDLDRALQSLAIEASRGNNDRARAQVRLLDDMLVQLQLDAAMSRGLTFANLTRAETRVLVLLSSPMRLKDIAAELFLSVNTIRTHVRHIYRKLEVTCRDEAISCATEETSTHR